MTTTHTPSVLKPVGHVVIAFPDEDAQRDAAEALRDAGVPAEAVHRYTPRQMADAIDAESASSGPLASLGQDMNLARHRRDLADDGASWLIVAVDDDAVLRHVSQVARDHGATLAQKYGRLIVEELL